MMAEETTNGANNPNGLSDDALRRMLSDLNGEALAQARRRAERDRQARDQRERHRRAHPLARVLAGYATLRPCACGRWHDGVSPDATLAALYRHVRRREANQQRAHREMLTLLGLDADGQGGDGGDGGDGNTDGDGGRAA